MRRIRNGQIQPPVPIVGVIFCLVGAHLPFLTVWLLIVPFAWMELVWTTPGSGGLSLVSMLKLEGTLLVGYGLAGSLLGQTEGSRARLGRIAAAGGGAIGGIGLFVMALWIQWSSESWSADQWGSRIRAGLTSPNPWIRSNSAFKLAWYEDRVPSCVDDLTRLLSDPDSGVRCTAAHSLAGIGPRAKPARWPSKTRRCSRRWSSRAS